MKYGQLIIGLMISSLLTTSVQAAGQAIQVSVNHVQSSYAKTKYPIVFNHGMAGFNRIGTEGLGLDYWYQILPNLARNGANTWATRVSPFHSTEVRGEQLLQQVESILAITGATKVNLVGHSHGGPTIRYVAAMIPKKVASLTTVGSPHKGAHFADLVLKAENTILQIPLVAVVTVISKLIIAAQGLNSNVYPHNPLASAKSLSTADSLKFNAKFPLGIPNSTCGDGPAEKNGIYLYSFTGTSQLTNLFDPDAVLKITGAFTNGGRDNDGLVARCSTKFGKTIRDNYNWNHMDEVNQFLGLRAANSPDPLNVYLQHANRLKNQGL